MKKLLVISILSFSLTSFALSFSIPEPKGYINDLADIIEADEELILEQQIIELEKNTTDEIAILTLPSLEGEDIDMLGVEIAENRGIGKEGEDNGLLIIVAPNERKRRVDIGYGLEGTIPDAIAYRFGSQILPDYFREESYGEGLIALNEKLIPILEGREDIPEEMLVEEDSTWFGYLIAMTILIMILSPLLRSFLKKSKQKSYTATTGATLMTVLGIAIFGIGLLLPFLIWFFMRRFIGLFGTSPSTGGWTSGRSNGGRSGGGSFGGFGGFGGGSFGGGGASGGR